MTATRYKSRLPTTGLTNELYFSSHKPDGDNEKTPPVLMRNKRCSPHLNIVSADDTPSISNNRRPISSPIRSTTYVLQQHHRIINNQNNITNKKVSSPVQHQQPSPSITPMTLNKNRQTQQQRTFSNHERSPIRNPSTPNQQFISRTQIPLTPRRTSPIVKSTPTKTPPTTTITPATYVSRSPRVREKKRRREINPLMNIDNIII